jgi:hypothetical protein
MKYIILGKGIKKGTINDDSSDLSTYFELGWEVVGSRIDIINYLQSNKIDVNELTLVTLEDRKFMYNSFYPNVISFDEYLKVKKNEDSVEDWTITRNFSFLNAYNNFVNPQTKELQNIERDYELLFNGYNLESSDYNYIKENYVVLALRYREHNSGKNADEIFFKDLVLKIKNQICDKVFVVGYGSEKFSTDNNCVYINRLVDFVCLIKNKNCLSLVAQSTGTLCLALMSSNSHIHLLDHTKCSDLLGDNAVLGGKCVQLFTNGLTPYYTFSHDIIQPIVDKIKNFN